MIGQLQVGNPEFLMNEIFVPIYDYIFSSNKLNLKFQLLSNLVNITQQEALNSEKNFLKAKSEIFSKNTSTLIDAKMLAGNSSYEAEGSSFFLQSYIDQIMECVLDTDLFDYNNIGFELLSIILDQGLVHPLKVAIESLPQSALRKRASKLHLEISSKFDSFIHSQDIEGVKLAYQTQLAVHDNNYIKVAGFCLKNIYKGSEYEIEGSLQPLYDTVINKKPKRNTLIKDLVSLVSIRLKSYFEDPEIEAESSSGNVVINKDDLGILGYPNSINTFPLDRELVEAKARSTNEDIEETYNELVPFSRYIIENLLTIQYSVVDEVLFLIKELSKIVGSYGFLLMHIFDSFIPMRARRDLDFETISAGEDDMKTKRATVASIIVGALLILRETLKLTYKVSETRCASYASGDISPTKEKATFNPVLSLSNHWSLFEHTSKQETSEKGISKSSRNIIMPSWKAWPFAIKIPETLEEFKKQRLIYMQLFTDLTSVTGVTI
ncbi:hypothetical protein BB560_000792 [Smittium megazygosporum]|uniref:Sister chromatid cohesion protein n=1 Tax=Smittium megazygosporum TaxID=133381 RepID=A0A2T9ZJH1_9FUNG|nr:hypothetical protein BB560_000792 [Smittium megazygosporum]